MAKDWTTILDAVIVPTGEERTVTEYLERGAATWHYYRTSPNATVVGERQIHQRRMKQTETDGKVSYYWETLSTLSD
jgi:hypothetical protein